MLNISIHLKWRRTEQVRTHSHTVYSIILPPVNYSIIQCTDASLLVTVNYVQTYISTPTLRAVLSCNRLIFPLHMIHVRAPDSPSLYSMVQTSLPKNDVDLKCQEAVPVLTINAETQLNMAKKDEEVINV